MLATSSADVLSREILLRFTDSSSLCLSHFSMAVWCRQMMAACRLRFVWTAAGSRALLGRRNFSGRNMKAPDSLLSSSRCLFQKGPFMKSSGLSLGLARWTWFIMLFKIWQTTRVPAKPAYVAPLNTSSINAVSSSWPCKKASSEAGSRVTTWMVLVDGPPHSIPDSY